MAIKTIILHAGMHKTGTSSIQNSFFDGRNAPFLIKKGYRYLSEWSENHDVATSFLFFENCDKDFNMIQNGYREKHDEMCTNFVVSLKNVIQSSSAESLIISAEGLSRFTFQDFARLKSFFTGLIDNVHFRIIMYVREPLSYHISAKQTLIRFGISPKGAAKYSYFQNQLSPIISSFTREEIEFYRFEDAIAFGGPVQHFLNILGFELYEIDQFHIEIANESACYVIVKALEYLNKIIPIQYEKGDRYFINPKRKEIDINPLIAVRGPKYDYDYNQKTKLVAKLIDDVQWLLTTTGIDYIDSLKHFKGREHDYDENTLTDIETVFPKLHHSVRAILLEFLEVYYRDVPDIAAMTSKLKNESSMLDAIEQELGFRDSFWPLPHKEYVQIFIDTGNGFSAQESCKFAIAQDKSIAIDLSIPADELVYDVRVDPSVGLSSVLVKLLLINGQPGGFTVTRSNCFWHGGSIFLFMAEDPQILIHSDTPVKNLSAELIVDLGVTAMEKYIGPILAKRTAGYKEQINQLRTKIKENEDNNIEYAQIYTDYGHGFREADSIKVPVSADKRVTLNLDFDSERAITQIRLDPSRGPSLTIVEQLLINGQSDGFQIEGGNYTAREGDTFLFLLSDPQILIHADDTVFLLQVDLMVDTDEVAMAAFVSNLLLSQKTKYEAYLTEQKNAYEIRILDIEQSVSNLQTENIQLTREGELLSAFIRRYVHRVLRKVRRIAAEILKKTHRKQP